MKKLFAIVISFTVLAAACNYNYNVGGDSQMQAVATEIEQTVKMTQNGCGWTGELGFPWNCSIPLNPPVKNKVVLGVSHWDAFATDLSAYRTVTDYYNSFGVNVIWVEVWPDHNAPPWTYEILDNLNKNVAAELGCQLAPGHLRDAELVDWVHYSEYGREIVAARFQLINGPVCT